MKFNQYQPLSIIVCSFLGIILAISAYPASGSELSNPNHKIISRHTPELEGFDLHHPDISQDGKFIAFTASFNFGNIWVSAQLGVALRKKVSAPIQTHCADEDWWFFWVGELNTPPSPLGDKDGKTSYARLAGGAATTHFLLDFLRAPHVKLFLLCFF